jgi:hypothetical protein
MSFKENNYQIIRNVVPSDVINFCFDYFMIKRDAVDFMQKNNMIPDSPLNFFGSRNDPQALGVYSHYADTVMETLLLKVMPVMQKQTKLNLVPTYSYARIYEHGSTLEKHKDRPSCEISTTLNLGGDNWPIYIEPNKNIGHHDNNSYVKGQTEGIEVNLNPGDMLVYAGHDLEHWRKPFNGKICAQVFLHYNHVEGPFAVKNKFDGRPLLGLPHAQYEKE